MREKMSFSQTLNVIGEAEEQLLAFAKGEGEPSNGRVGALKALLDSKWKRIDRVLPPLKAIEHSGEDGGTMTIQLVRYGDDTDTGE